jgi:hypothetical protein
MNRGKNVPMTRDQIESAVARGGPFTLRMADGKEYPVPHRDYISVSPRGACVIVWDDTGHFTVLPLLTMTGLHTVDTPDGVTDQETPSGSS